MPPSNGCSPARPGSRTVSTTGAAGSSGTRRLGQEPHDGLSRAEDALGARAAEVQDVIVTDRKDLQRQLSETAGLIGETVKVGKSILDVKKLLAKKGPAIVFATIQKYVDRALKKIGPDEELGDLGLLDDNEAVLVMVDEAHRSHSNSLHAALAPGAAKLRAHRLHRDAHHHGRQEAYARNLRRVH